MTKFLQKTVSIAFLFMICVNMINAQLNPVKNLTGSCSNSGKVTLNWSAPDSHSIDGFWLTYSSNEIYGSIGTGQDGDVMSVARFAASDLTAKGVTPGDRIVQMQIVLNPAGCSDLNLKVWSGGSFLVIPIINLVIANPGTLEVDQRVDLSTIVSNNWTTITLLEPHPINTTSELWMGYSVTANASAYPLAYDSGPRVNNKSDILNFSNQWSTLYLATQQQGSLDLNACIKAFVSKEDPLFVSIYEIYQDGEKVGETTSRNFTVEGLHPGEYNFCVKAVYNNSEASEEVCRVTVCDEVCNPVTNLNVTFSEACVAATITWTKPALETAFPIKYNVYRNEDIIASEIEETSYIDEGFDDDVQHTWRVETVCLTLVSTEVNVAKVCGVGIGESLSNIYIYPNPASQTVTIQMDKFQKVEIYNTFGQLLGGSHTATVDISAYSQGVYFFKVFDLEGNAAVRRVAVVK
ncbi:MAG: T9SS type A sorting domain-containing protein [Lentimicrobiaceae bacterium]|nr:T9SS type A sorting domain-containing protein [Lentimicrobiaceae bacterium]